MTNEPAPATPEKKMDAREWTKIVLVSTIGTAFTVAVINPLTKAAISYGDWYYEEEMMDGGNPAAAHGEAAIGELMVIGMGVAACLLVAALIVFVFMRLLWRKKPDAPVRDIIRVHGR